jgi:hypothetical protein
MLSSLLKLFIHVLTPNQQIAVSEGSSRLGAALSWRPKQSRLLKYRASLKIQKLEEVKKYVSESLFLDLPDPKDGGKMLLRNVGSYLPVDKA